MQDVGMRRRRWPEVEWPTVGLAVAIYAGWLAITFWHAALPLVLLVPAGAWLVCWHSSLQHEALHGHPTRSRAINRVIAFPPLALWLPYDRYRATHLAHHHDERLTDPIDDPESRYVTAAQWRRLGPLGRGLVAAQATLAGRLVIGPFWAIAVFLFSEFHAIRRGDGALRGIWLAHGLGVAAVCVWLVFACGLNVGFYVLAFVLPGTALMLMRSFAEHKAAGDVKRRTAVVEGNGPLALLYLFNNLHAAHHDHPTLPWYRLPAFYRANRDGLLACNGGLLYRGYADVLRRFLLRPHDRPLHPQGRVARH